MPAFFLFLKLYAFILIDVCVVQVYVYAGACRSQKTLDRLELELQVTLSHLIWALRTEFASSERGASALNPSHLSSLFLLFFFLTGVGTQRHEMGRPTTDPQSKLEKFPPRQVCWTSCPCDKILDISNLKEGRFIRNFKQRSPAPIACSEAEGQ